jgi:hypothetical protein
MRTESSPHPPPPIPNQCTRRENTVLGNAPVQLALAEVRYDFPGLLQGGLLGQFNLLMNTTRE